MSPRSSSPLPARSLRSLRFVAAFAVAVSGAVAGVDLAAPSTASAAPGGDPNPGEAVIEVVPRAKEYNVGKESAHGRFVCDENGVMVYRHHGTPGHKGDENEPTKYRCADVTLNGVKAEVVSTERTVAYDEDKYPSKAEILCPAGQVMVGRFHEGDQTGPTYHVCGKLQVAGIDLVPTTIRESDDIQESGKDSGKYYSEFEAPEGHVFVGRYHKDDENGMTHYKFAQLAVGGLPAPQGLIVDATHDSAALEWKAVENELVRFTYEVTANGKKLDPTVEPKLALRELTPASRQEIEVRAKLADQTSAPMQGWFQTSPPPEPTKPRSLQIDNTLGTEATIRWAAPANPAKTQKYQVSVNGKTVGETPTRAYRLQDLKHGTAYRVEVRARGPWIDSEALEGSFVATPPPSAPNAPHSLVISDPATNAATLEWQPPVETGGAPITEYSIKVDALETVMTDLPKHRIAGLKPGTHTVEIRARNVAGFSEPLAASFDTLPKKPVLDQVTQIEGTKQVKVTWKATDELTKSVQIVRNGEVVVDGLPTEPLEAIVDDNEFNTEYSFAVRAVGTSGYSESAAKTVTPVANAFEERPLKTVDLNRKKAVGVRTAFESTVAEVKWFDGKVEFSLPPGLTFAEGQDSVVGAIRTQASGNWVKNDAVALTKVTTSGNKRKLTATIEVDEISLPLGAQVSWVPKVEVAQKTEPGSLALTWTLSGAQSNLGPASVSGSAAMQVPAFPAPAAPVITGVEQSGSSAVVYWGGDLTWVDGFQVYRDGVLLRDKLDPTATSVEITPHEPGKEYQFTVVARGPGGTASSPVQRLVAAAPDEDSTESWADADDDFGGSGSGSWADDSDRWAAGPPKHRA